MLAQGPIGFGIEQTDLLEDKSDLFGRVLTHNPAIAYPHICSCFFPDVSIITLPFYPDPFLVLALIALGIAQNLPLKQLVLDWCCLPSRATQGTMATIGTLTSLEKLCLQSSVSHDNEAAKVSGLLALACSLMTFSFPVTAGAPETTHSVLVVPPDPL